MQNVTREMFNGNIFLQNYFIMGIGSSPLGNSSVEETNFPVRIPAAVPDKLTAIICAPVHPVGPDR